MTRPEPARYYTPGRLSGRRCTWCGYELPTALDGDTTHPTCGQDAANLLRAAGEAARRRRRPSRRPRKDPTP